MNEEVISDKHKEPKEIDGVLTDAKLICTLMEEAYLRSNIKSQELADKLHISTSQLQAMESGDEPIPHYLLNSMRMFIKFTDDEFEELAGIADKE